MVFIHLWHFKKPDPIFVSLFEMERESDPFRFTMKKIKTTWQRRNLLNLPKNRQNTCYINSTTCHFSIRLGPTSLRYIFTPFYTQPLIIRYLSLSLSLSLYIHSPLYPQKAHLTNLSLSLSFSLSLSLKLKSMATIAKSGICVLVVAVGWWFHLVNLKPAHLLVVGLMVALLLSEHTASFLRPIIWVSWSPRPWQWSASPRSSLFSYAMLVWFFLYFAVKFSLNTFYIR